MTLASSTFFLLMWQIEIICGLIIHGKPDEGYLFDLTKARSFSECERKICNKDPKTCRVIAFSQKHFSCRRYRIPTFTGYRIPAFFFWIQHVMISNESDFKTDVKISSKEEALTKNLPRPKIFWLFDSTMKGKNVVSTDSALDMDVSFITNWNYTGPPQNSANIFLYSDTGTTHEKEVAVVHNKIRLISYKPTFTVSMWIKIVSGHRFPLFTCQTYCAFSYFEDQRIKYTSGPDGFIRSTKIREKKHEWRHFAITQGPNAPTFFMNGEILLIENYSDEVYREITNPRGVKLRFGGYAGLHGSMACYMIFETQMSPEQIRSVMKSCP